MAAKSVTTTDASASFFTALPDDLLQRVLVGVPLDDHHAAAAVCQAFRGVITGSRFPALRQKYGFAERAVVTVRIGRDGPGRSVLNILMAHESAILATIPLSGLSSYGTTDGGTRLFISTNNLNDTPPNQVLAVDASSRRWKRLVNMPQNHSEHCMEWHGGLLYVAGGFGQNGERLNSFYAFNEATGIWEDLPPMPQACTWAASGVIGNELLIVGGYHESDGYLVTLQIYDIDRRTWRLGADLPTRAPSARGYVVDGKLCVMNVYGAYKPVLVYDPQADTWTEEAPAPSALSRARFACVHDGRLIVYQENGTVIERATDGLWFPIAHVEPQRSWSYKSVFGSVLLA